MAKKLTQGSIIPEFRYDTPYLPQQSFYELLNQDKPVIIVFLRNFGHPLSRHYIMEYIKTAEELTDARLACVVQTRPQVIASAIPQNSMPYQLICDEESVLYRFFGVETEENWLKSYSFKGLKILKEAKKQGFQERRSEPQQLPLTIVVGKEGEVLFAHYGQSITDLPEDCGAMQRVMEGLLAMLEEQAKQKAEPEEESREEETGWSWENPQEEEQTVQPELFTEQEEDSSMEPIEQDETAMETVLTFGKDPEEEASEEPAEEILGEESEQEENEILQEQPAFEQTEEIEKAEDDEQAEEEPEERKERLFDFSSVIELPDLPEESEKREEASQSAHQYGAPLPKTAPREKPKIDLAALGFLNEDEN